MKNVNVTRNRHENLVLCSVFMCFLLTFLVCTDAKAQYEDNPLKGRKWFSVTGGVNTADYLSWQGLASFSSRGETVLTQARLGYSQELIKAPGDSCRDNMNRLSEAGLLWGDGWGKKNWFVTGAIGFGLNVRMYCDHGAYENRYLTAVTLGVPAQVEFGLQLSKQIGIELLLSGNWNFRAPYGGVHIGIFYRLS
jgi:hypothetical protein